MYIQVAKFITDSKAVHVLSYDIKTNVISAKEKI